MKREVRKSQLVSPHGVGAVIDINDEGFVIKDISEWKRPERLLKSKQLKNILGKNLRAFGDGDDFVPVDRFPKWHFCSSCRSLFHWPAVNDWNKDSSAPICCENGKVVPMRFVAVCDNGHLAEIDWYNWAHQGGDEAESGQCNRSKMKLRFVSEGKFGGDFDQMRVICDNCNRSKNLENVGRKAANRFVVRAKNGQNCVGKQPWHSFETAEACDQAMFIEPRGSSTIYSPKTLSALELEFEDGSSVDYHDSVDFKQKVVKVAETISDKAGSAQLAAIDVEEGNHDALIQLMCDEDEWDEEGFKIALINYLKGSNDERADEIFDENELAARIARGQTDILNYEFSFFQKHVDVQNGDLSVSFRDLVDGSSNIREKFSKVGLVRRLREVRCLAGFKRGKGLKTVDVDLTSSKDWLPAIETFGEGIYIELDKNALRDWERSNADQITQIIHELNGKFETSFLSEIFQLDISASFLIAHTLSHLLIRELTLQSGYPSSSLKERVYANGENNAAFLIYAADIDESGTMGGLVEQGRPEVFINSIENAINKAQWCSGDPVCKELEHQGLAGLNNASCHCCSLISETSCAYSNVFLNRLLLIGSGSNGEPKGFFSN